MEGGYLGEMQPWGPDFSPKNWVYCHGQLLPIDDNKGLFSIIGTIFGGDGKTTFALPDLRGRSPIHPGRGPGVLKEYNWGEQSGTHQNSLTVDNLPPHKHEVIDTLEIETENLTAKVERPCGPGPGTTDIIEGNYFAVPQTDAADDWSTPHEASSRMAPSEAEFIEVPEVGGEIKVEYSGRGIPISNYSSAQGIDWIICIEGKIPTRA